MAKAQTSTDKPQPRSVRLTKELRANIINSIIEKWDRRNDLRYKKERALVALIEGTVKEYRTPKRGVAPEFKKLSQVFKYAEHINLALSTLTSEEKGLLIPDTAGSWLLRIVDGNGDKVDQVGFMLPSHLAEKLGIPGVRKNKCNGAPDPWVSYSEENGEFYSTHLPDPSYTSIFLIPANSPIYKSYLAAKAEVDVLEKEQAQLREEATDYLEQFNTTGQIREFWPELEQYLPAHVADPAKVTKLPALTKSRLNERLGL